MSEPTEVQNETNEKLYMPIGAEIHIERGPSWHRSTCHVYIELHNPINFGRYKQSQVCVDVLDQSMVAVVEGSLQMKYHNEEEQPTTMSIPMENVVLWKVVQLKSNG